MNFRYVSMSYEVRPHSAHRGSIYCDIVEKTETFADAMRPGGVIHPRLSFGFSVSSGSLTS